MRETDRILKKAQGNVAGLKLHEDHTPAAPPTQPTCVLNPGELAPLIEHTNLQAHATPEDIEILCLEARMHGFFGVCVNPGFVALAKQKLKGSKVQVIAVIGFPLGATATQAKAREVEIAMAAGADEFDMVIPIGLMRSGALEEVFLDIRSVVEAADECAVKVIIETGLLTGEQIATACLLAARAGARFVKTATGFNCDRGATCEDVCLMRRSVGQRLGIKAAGGIREYEQARRLVEAGACRIGSSASVSLVTVHESKTDPLPHLDRLYKALDHGRDLFKYHAGQRLTSIRYSLVVVAFFATGFVSALKTDTLPPDSKRGVLLVLGVACLVTTAAMWALDFRNVQLVDASERLVRHVEAELTRATGIKEYETVRFTDTVAPRWIRYGHAVGKTHSQVETASPPRGWFGVMTIVFSVFVILALFGIWYALCL